MFPADHADRLQRARLSLEGLSVGDAFGERFFVAPKIIMAFLQDRAMPKPPWSWTDDTEMACGVVEVLERAGGLDTDDLARTFARRYLERPSRGYGAAAHTVLQEIGAGADWRKSSAALFRGEGSKGNGAAMRVAPLGAYYADDLVKLVEHARAQAAITHSHPDGQAGAIAIAVAAAWAWNHRENPRAGRGPQMIDAVLEHTPAGATRDGLSRARELPERTAVTIAANALGSGVNVTSADTVPFAIWCAARYLDDFAECLWNTVSGLGDRDTTCAMAGGIVALATGHYGIPPTWLAAREPLFLTLPADDEATPA